MTQGERIEAMSVEELDRNQLIQIKQQMLMERMDEEGVSSSWGEFAEADYLITDEEVQQEYAGTDFVTADFWQ